jgi:glycosyltransferase involved in cell wall biosynthesis
MRVGVAIAEDTWHFFEDIYRDLASHYDVSVFERPHVKVPVFYHRLNNLLFQRQLDAFLGSHDIVFFEWGSELLAAATMRPKKCRIVTRIHRYEMFRWIPRINWDLVDRIILVSEAMRTKFVAQCPAHAHKTVVIHESVSTERFRPPSKDFAGDVGTLCFLSPRKRVYELILAFHDLRHRYGRVHLHIGGAEKLAHLDYADALRSLVGKLDLDKHVTFYGPIGDAAVWYRHIDIFVSNSYSEGLQVAPMEAMASGRYTLAHRWDGAEELLPEDYLFLTDGELQQKIISYCEASDAERQRQQERMRAIAREKFDVELIKGQIRSVLEEVARPAAGAAAGSVIASPTVSGGPGV